MSEPSPSLPADILQPLVTALLVVTPLGSVLIPLVITLFFFSTSQSRRRPIFPLIIIACCCGICEAGVTIAMTVNLIRDPLHPLSKYVYTVANIFSLVAALFIDSILLFRILAFYPLNVTPNTKLMAIFALPILVKCGRFTMVMLYLYQFTHVHVPSLVAASKLILPRNPYILVYSSLQVIDNSYASLILLYKIHQFKRDRDDIFILTSTTLFACLRSLILIALGNFVFPVIINIVVIIMIAADSNFSNTVNVMICNNFISIIGVVFATIWTRRRYWNVEDQVPGSSDFRLESSKSDRSRNVLSTLRLEEESVHTGIRIDMQTSVRTVQDDIDGGLNSPHTSSLTKTQDVLVLQ